MRITVPVPDVGDVTLYLYASDLSDVRPPDKVAKNRAANDRRRADWRAAMDQFEAEAAGPELVRVAQMVAMSHAASGRLAHLQIQRVEIQTALLTVADHREIEALLPGWRAVETTTREYVAEAHTAARSAVFWRSPQTHTAVWERGKRRLHIEGDVGCCESMKWWAGLYTDRTNEAAERAATPAEAVRALIQCVRNMAAAFDPDAA